MEWCSRRNSRQFRAILLWFRHNCRGFWRAHRLGLGFLLVTASLDAMTTCHFMLLQGVHREVHPYIRFLGYWLGPVWGSMLGKTLQVAVGLIGVVYVRRYASLLLTLASAFYLYAAFHNLLFSGFFAL
jgi:hypothetical protein